VLEFLFELGKRWIFILCEERPDDVYIASNNVVHASMDNIY
jgi:hypothetical protein